MKKIFIILILVTLCFGCSKEKLPNDLSFDSEVWKTANKRTRGRMSPNLAESKLLIGKTKIEVENILGKHDYEIEDMISYEVDVGEGWYYVITVVFNKTSEKVIEASLGD